MPLTKLFEKLNQESQYIPDKCNWLHMTHGTHLLTQIN